MPIASLLLALQATAVTIPDRPAAGSYVVDQANLLDARSIADINATAAKSDRRGRPIYVVTIVSLAEQDAQALTIDEYARRVFDAWRIGGGPQSRGALLLVSARDRAARIELGHAWNNERDAEMRGIMARDIIPGMRANEPTRAIVQATANISGAISPWSVGKVGMFAIALLLTGAGWLIRRLPAVGMRDRPLDPQYAGLSSVIDRARAARRLDPNARNFNMNLPLTDTRRERRPYERPDNSIDRNIWGGDIGGGGGSSGDGGSSSGGGGATGSW